MFTAIDASPLNAFSHVDRERATLAAGVADVSLPFGGVPIGVKELDQVIGWPDTNASVPLADRVAPHTSANVQRIRELVRLSRLADTHSIDEFRNPATEAHRELVGIVQRLARQH